MSNVTPFCRASIEERQYDERQMKAESFAAMKDCWIKRDVYWRNKELEKRPDELLELIEDEEDRLLFCKELVKELMTNKDYSDAALNMIEMFNEKKKKVNLEIATNLAELEYGE